MGDCITNSSWPFDSCITKMEKNLCKIQKDFVSLQRKPKMISIMENLKLVSVRIDPEELKDLDRIASHLTYYKRSDLINAGIRLVIALEHHKMLQKALSFYPRYGDVLDNISLEYHREVK